MKKKVLVTGAGGLLGGCIKDYLISKKHDVVAVYHRNVCVNPEESYFQMDLSNTSSYKALDSLKIDIVIHCAATIPISFYGEETVKIAETNSIMDINIIEFCERKGIRLVYMSSCSIYGFNHQELKSEDSRVAPIGYYSVGKHDIENRILNSCVPNPVILRVSSPYGFNQKHQTVLKLFIEKAFNNENILYHGSGTREQDFINMFDIAVAVEKIIHALDKYGIFNIASGQAVTMKQLAKLIVNTIRSDSIIKPSNQIDAQEGYKVNIEIIKAKTLLNWKPQVTLEQGINDWAEYLRKRL